MSEIDLDLVDPSPIDSSWLRKRAMRDLPVQASRHEQSHPGESRIMCGGSYCRGMIGILYSDGSFLSIGPPYIDFGPPPDRHRCPECGTINRLGHLLG